MSAKAIEGLKPELLWQRFYELSQIPRPSKKEERVTAHLEQFFKQNKIAYTKDKTGNLIARIPATRGYGKAPIVVLQGHSDMVCEKNRDTQFDFDHDPIRLLREGEWITADGTTLGADNGIGVAAALAIATDPTAVHGPLEILVTVDEETGLTGANRLSGKLLKGKFLLNLDSEEDGIFYVGCAGGIDTSGVMPVQTIAAPAGYQAFWLRISGLKGGHSGCDIHMGRGNAIKLLARLLDGIQDLKPVVSEMTGGSKRNAIPREAEALVAVSASAVEKLQQAVARFDGYFKNELKNTDGGVAVSLESTALPATMYAPRMAKKLVQTLLALPHGVMAMSADIEGLVETSTNLATVSAEGNTLVIGTNQRSSIDSSKRATAAQVVSVFRLAGCKVRQGDGYPGWQPNLQAQLLEVCKDVAVRLYGQIPEIKAIHAGLECGILGGKYPEMEMISFGPTITGAHSPDERVHIPAVGKFYDLLKAVLKELAVRK